LLHSASGGFGKSFENSNLCAIPLRCSTTPLLLFDFVYFGVLVKTTKSTEYISASASTSERPFITLMVNAFLFFTEGLQPNQDIG